MSHTSPAMRRPKAVEAKNAVLMWRASRFGRCTSAGPSPSCEKVREKPMMMSAAPTTPKSAGDRRRVRRTITISLSTAVVPPPHANHIIPLSVRWVRLGGCPSRFPASSTGGPARLVPKLSLGNSGADVNDVLRDAGQRSLSAEAALKEFEQRHGQYEVILGEGQARQRDDFHDA